MSARGRLAAPVGLALALLVALVVALLPAVAGAQTTTGTELGQAEPDVQQRGSQAVNVYVAETTTGTPTAPEITPEQAGDGVLMAAADRVELASSLAEATSETGVCFGYVVQLSDSGVPKQDAVSSAGPNQRVAAGPECSKGAIELQVSITYTCGSCESEDSAAWSVVSTVPGLSSSTVRSRLEDLSSLSSGDLLGDDDDKALRNATAALPLTLDQAVPAEPATAQAAPGGDHLTGKPGSDWLRANGIGFAISLVVLLVALTVVFFAWRMRRSQRRAPRRDARGRFASTAAAPPTAPPTPTSDDGPADADPPSSSTPPSA
ncbi:hypothetical protein [Patulibacter defluvii]|uniref:hypothetical protein n=1 Tax=Patulibacter defluvii TaxID=3095358 RepID=UPI002A75D711|nr:hypothetical protein [Patulibacter sp. DM4]